MITITDTAAAQISEILAAETDKTLKLRIFVQGGGCNGVQTGFSLDNTQNDDDFIMESNNITMMVDSVSFQYLQESTIDYKTTNTSSGFTIDIPTATSHCSCGSSFSID
jgi:iron-sulfur cluster insertion protein